MRRFCARADVLRGGFAESVHEAIACVARPDGTVLLAAGEVERFAFPRSSLKPLQALAPVAAGVKDVLSLHPSEVAVFCGSHSGEAFHVQAVRSILSKIGLGESALQCGTHWPCEAASDELRARGETPASVHNNCSGKHAGMLACCVAKGLPTDSYLDPNNPVQQEILANIAAMTDTLAAAVVVGVDGCAAPTLGVPVRGMAMAFARLAAPEHAPPGLGAACREIAAAMVAHPEMVAGTGRNCTRLSVATQGGLVVKSGAEGFFAAALPGHGLGVAVKIVDGGHRATVPVALACLAELGLLERAACPAVDDLWAPLVTNCRGDVVGEIRAVLTPASADAERAT